MKHCVVFGKTLCENSNVESVYFLQSTDGTDAIKGKK